MGSNKKYVTNLQGNLFCLELVILYSQLQEKNISSHQLEELQLQVILESLRMSSIISFTFREAVADVEYDGKSLVIKCKLNHGYISTKEHTYINSVLL